LQSVSSLRSSEGFRQFVLDQLESLDVTARSMFGGTGLYAEGVFFGLIALDTLYLKVDDTNRPLFEREGMEPFKPYENRPVTMMYYAVPVGVLESAPELLRWARMSVEAASRAASGVPGRERPRAARSATRAKRPKSTAASHRDRMRR
jgi:DNA transformation protein